MVCVSYVGGGVLFSVNLLFYLIFCSLLLMFLSTNLLLIYFSFEFRVIPVFLLVSGWGYSLNRFQAGIYMFLYTIITSLPMFYFLLGIWFIGGVDFDYLIYILNFYSNW